MTTKLHLPIPNVPKTFVCPWLLTIGIFMIGGFDLYAPELERYMTTVVGVAWAWSRPE